MQICDDAVTKNLYHDVLRDISFFPESMGLGEKIATELNSYHDEKASCFAPYMFWEGWWLSGADTLRKKVIRELWGNRLPAPQDEILGFEYWTRTYLPGQYLDVHVDEDTFLYAGSKTFSGPFAGGIWYGCDNDQGGFLEIHKSVFVDGEKMALERDNIDRKISPIEQRERIAYRGNRFIGFDAGHVLHSTTPATSGKREVMVINVWHKNNPPTALKLNEFFYE
jgi:hypothetical protein